ncbi:hypothetical protein RB653_004032 [Dictyostelium firmibasis]|uniref:Cytochrome P450 n=1 Tax=Dictyostelium firmibasis TaxID=79012 RepID=A0AAN7U5Q1_9MYCE
MEISSFTIILIIIFVLLKKLIQKEDRIHRINKNIPGPKSKFLFGNLFDLKGQVHEKINEWYEQYGSIYRIEFGSVSTVVLSEYSTLKEAFIDNGEIFQSRFQRKSRTACNKELNLANSNGEYFNHLKKTLANEMTNQKMKKKEKIIKRQVFLLSEFFNEISQQSPTNSGGISKEPINNIIKMYSLNVMLSLLFNIHFPYNSNSYQEELIITITRYFKSTGLPYPSDFIPTLYPFLKNKPKEYFEDYESVKKLITKITNDYQINHMLEINENSTIEDIENYQPKNILESLLKQYKLKNISYDGVIGSLMDLILAGSDTTGNTCLFSIVALVNNSNIQEKLFNEISNAFKDEDENDIDNENLNGANIITNNSSSLDNLSYFSDRIKTPYLVAFIKEVKRYYPSAPLSVPHLLTEDCEIQGYKISKGTQIIQNIYSTHLSPSFCSNPLEFYPERFLDSNNEPKIIPFGIGQRKCPGENIFEIEIYVFLVNLIKKFKLSHPINDNYQLNDRGQFGLSLQCPQFNIKVESR